MSKLLRLVHSSTRARVAPRTVDLVSEVVTRLKLEYRQPIPEGYRHLRGHETPQEGDLTYDYVAWEWEFVDAERAFSAWRWRQNNFDKYVELWHIDTVRRLEA